jgi:GT2 family glycosyltransferase
MENAFTYVIGYRHSDERLNNLRRSIDWVSGFGGVDLIIVEQDKHSKISHLNLKGRHIFVKSDGPYNRSWAFNVAISYAKSDLIVFSDSDLIMEPNDFIESLRKLKYYDMVNPYKSVLDLKPDETKLAISDMFKIERAGRGENDHQKVPLCGGISIFRMDAIKRIGGWDEGFVGWGGEDNFQTLKVENFLNFTQMDHKCYHLYHERTSPDMKLYEKTLNRLNKLNNLSKNELSKFINSTMGKIGARNKYTI